ncbi:GntR family transcriptional regulator [Dactylosporangium sp. NPDC000555]|uniref:GntR family transcriptional regulator n=1 Tax=Dactylosporangium fulvum TaxID=53359 RepID=A0ABY5VSU6_9ACTN|nr:GntR family transcriptional regulator [Dactylosporangium fulvum]UWP80277.1 GntR family transcriptional regulator [Dactylosporangium fulvum]
MADRVFNRINIKRLHNEVQHQIRELIDSGILKPGQTLPPERELAEQLGVSRNSLREALRVLEARGIIVTRHGVGRAVRDVQPTGSADWSLTDSIEVITINEVLDARALLEPRAAELACLRHTDEEMREILDAAKDHSSWADTIRFHNAIAAAAHHVVIEQLINHQLRLLEELRQRDRYRSDDDAHTLTSDHLQIAAAIERRDAEAARSLMQKHLQQTHDSIDGLS